VESGRRASSAFTSAKNVAEGAEKGGAVSLGANAAMERITASSGKIASITDIIDDIAFQSNLLALNASVEAARAGDAGAGFSVVAVEVRRLAQRTGQAAKEIQALIGDSVREVTTGTRLVAEANSALNGILVAARNNMDLTDAIFRESQTEAAAIEGLSQSVEELDRMTQDNSALVEETNAAVAQTESEAQRLDEMVRIFKVPEQRLMEVHPRRSAAA
jgi:methyl-accepting chemotaxis protein